MLLHVRMDRRGKVVHIPCECLRDAQSNYLRHPNGEPQLMGVEIAGDNAVDNSHATEKFPPLNEFTEIIRRSLGLIIIK